jgi:hypothetical protein
MLTRDEDPKGLNELEKALRNVAIEHFKKLRLTQNEWLDWLENHENDNTAAMKLFNHWIWDYAHVGESINLGTLHECPANLIKAAREFELAARLDKQAFMAKILRKKR